VVSKILDISVLDAYRLLKGHPIWVKRQLTQTRQQQIKDQVKQRFKEGELKITHRNYVEDHKKELRAQLAIQNPPLD